MQRRGPSIFFFNDTATTEIYTLSLHDALPILGGYPEWLDYCEDLVFDLALQNAGHLFGFAPEAKVWFRPRGSLVAFFRQYFRYARGDGKADLFRRRHAIRYAVYAALALLRYRRGRWLVLLLALGGLAYTRRPYARLRPHLD